MTLVFDGTTKAVWKEQSAYVGGLDSTLRVVQVPGGAPNGVPRLDFTAYNTDVSPYTPTTNPRVQLLSPDVLTTDPSEFWMSFLIYLPASFQTTTGYGFQALFAPMYGPPFNGTGPWGLFARDGTLFWQPNIYSGVTPNNNSWSTPVVLQQWHRYTVHFLYSASGWVELYYDGVQQTLSDPSGPTLRQNMSLINASNNTGPNHAALCVYYGLGDFTSNSVSYADFRIGTTRADVEPVEPRIEPVQQGVCASAGVASGGSWKLGVNISAGNTVGVIVVPGGGAGHTVTSVTVAGTPAVLGSGATEPGGNRWRVEVWYAVNVAGGSSAISVVTSDGSLYWAYAAEFSAVASGRGCGSSSGVSTTPSLTAYSQVGNVVLVGTVTDGLSLTSGPDFSWADFNNPAGNFSPYSWQAGSDVAYQITTQTGNATAAWGCPSQGWATAGLALSPASSRSLLSFVTGG